MMITVEIAKVCHEANKAYCQTLGDYEQHPWEMAPDWQKKSAIDGVKMHLETPDATPADSHENWMRAKLADGWKWGPVKDPEKKEHPCLVPYEDLPEEQKRKDALFIAIVRALAG